MKSKATFTRKDLIVVLSCVAFLLMNLAAISSNSRKRAREAVCLSNLRQWGQVFQMYTNDNNGYFMSGLISGREAGDGTWWMIPLKPYFKDRKLLLCPAATEGYASWFRDTQFAGNAHLGEARGAWHTKYKEKELFPGGVIGSYGPNGWICNTSGNEPPYDDILYGRSGHRRNAWKFTEVRGADKIPVFSDCMYFDAWPGHYDCPRDFEYPYAEHPWRDEMNRFCVNRHNGAVNGLLMDWSAREIGLKELWTLKWHRRFDTCNPWTKCGGVEPRHWPKWMRDFKDY